MVESWGVVMKILSQVTDKKVNALNVQFVIGICEYVSIAKNIIKNNPFQRNKVQKRGSVYSLLKGDIVAGCVIPPIVLASTLDDFESDNGDCEISIDALGTILGSYGELKILDGLQRTLTLIEAYEDNKEYFDSMMEPYLVRVEIYLSITETGILYRMLTLNTGQTPMTLRHQLEILYSKYLDDGIDGLEVLKDVDGRPVRSIYSYKFSDLIDGYTSYLEMSELPIDRVDILNAVKTAEFVVSASNGKSDFQEFSLTFNFVALVFDRYFKDWSYFEGEVPVDYEISSTPYGDTVYGIFNKSQTLTGFGAAMAGLVRERVFNKISDVKSVADQLIIRDEDLYYLNSCLDSIKGNAKKIGSAQRMFFKFFFKGVFDKDSSNYLNVRPALERAFYRTMSEM